MISHKNEANAVGGKTARACDNCIRKRARWYCTADDAFLCQSCDASVHSANPLARRHERVRLKTATSSQKHLAELLPHKKSSFSSSSSSWHRGFTKKPRTPRSGNPALRRASKSDQSAQNPFPLVPDVGGDETSNEESEEHLLYRVPAYDPFVAEISQSKGADMTPFSRETGALAVTDGGGSDDNRTKALCVDIENLHGFLPSDADLAEFAADVESLLGRGLENESFGIEGLGLIECKEGDDHNDDSTESSLGGTQMIKLEEEKGVVVEPVGARHGGDVEIDVSKETFELNFDYGSPISSGEEEGKAVVELEEKKVENSGGGEGVNHMEEKKKTRKEIFLALDYEAVIAAWANQGSPWTSSDRPDFSADDSWPDFMGMYGAEFQNPLYGGEVGLYGAHMGLADAGREAKVSRYREKRRTRLFSKKIRYEVRKLNAEKRPRMKGRFVKRASFAPTTFPSLSK